MPVRELLFGILPFSTKEKLLAVLWSYFDDSSDAKAERVFGIAGYVGSEAEWCQFEKGWKAITGETTFHMTDCLAGWGDYRGWSEPERIKLIRSLIDVINGVDIYGFHTGILLQDFREIFPKDGEDAPYFMCFQECFEQAAKWADNLGEDVAVVFDKNPSLEYRAHRLFNHICGLASRPGWEVMGRLASLTFSSKDKRFVPLESADIIAHTGYRLLNDLALKGESSLWWIAQMNEKRRLFGYRWDRERLLALREELIRARAEGVIPYVVKKKGEAK